MNRIGYTLSGLVAAWILTLPAYWLFPQYGDVIAMVGVIVTVATITVVLHDIIYLCFYAARLFVRAAKRELNSWRSR